MIRFKLFIFLFFLFSLNFASSQERKYELKVQHLTKNITGVDVPYALAINGSIPAPTLKFKLGETAVIHVINETKEPTTLHWHGVLVPWKQDGPQFYNTKIIEPGQSHTFRFPLKHTGTYWYHSHTQFQEQRGLYGAFIIEEEKPKPSVNHDFVFVMSDWSNEHPKKIISNLKKDGDYYKYKKKSLPSLWGAIRDGEFVDYLMSEWTRMGPMDLSDVGYDAFLINGKRDSNLKNIRAGEKIRFRLINASASTYFYFNIGNLRHFKVYSKDGVPVQPVEVNELLIGIAETYDVVFTLPQKMKTFMAQATAQDISGKATLSFGKGKLEPVPQKAKPSAFKMDHSSHGSHEMHQKSSTHKSHSVHQHHLQQNQEVQKNRHDKHGEKNHDSHERHQKSSTHKNHASHSSQKAAQHEGHQKSHKDHHSKQDQKSHKKHLHQEDKSKAHHKHSLKKNSQQTSHRLDYSMLKSVSPTEFNKNLIRAQVIELKLSGDMERYTWHINDKPFTENKYIRIKENEVITFKFNNTTMMHHPMHLHGHFFRVLLGQGKWAPLFHTVDVSPMSTVTIEFHANEPGIWFLHCHNLYHMKMGMARLVQYEGVEQTPELKQDQKKWSSWLTHDNTGFWKSEVGIYTHRSDLGLSLNKGRYQFDSELEFENYEELEVFGEGFLKRYLNRFLSLGVGAVWDDQKLYGAITLNYNFPGNIEMESYLRQDQVFVLRFEKEILLTGRVALLLASEFEYEDDWEVYFESGLHYHFNPHLSFGVHYEKEEEEVYGFGARFKF